MTDFEQILLKEVATPPGARRADVSAFVRFLKISLPDEEKIRFIESDPKDDKFLEAAIAGKVDFIVSGDNHLLELKEFRSIPIISGHEFTEFLKSE